MYCHWRSNYRKGDGWDPINLFNPAIFLSTSYVLFFFFYVQRFEEVIVDFVDNGGIVAHQCLNFLFITVTNKMNCELMLIYDTSALRLTGSRNLTGQKTLPTIWGTYMKLVTKYQIFAINSCWEKCDEKWAYMFNVYKNQQSRQTGSRNLTGPKTLPTIWYTYTTLVTKYQISAINSYWEKWTEVKQYTPLTLRGAGV